MASTVRFRIIAAACALAISVAAHGAQGHSDLWRAIRSGSVEAVRTQLDLGADAAGLDQDPMSETRTPLIVFAADAAPSVRATTEIVRVLLEHHAPVDSAVQGGPWNGETALFKAAKHGNASLVELLLEKGANPNRRLRDTGHTPLMSGAGYPEVARVLLEHGADLQATDNFGRTAVHFAALGGCPEAVEFLRRRGGRVNQPDKNGKTADTYLAEFGKEAIPRGICNPNPE